MFLSIKLALFCIVILIAVFGSRRSVLIAIAVLIPLEGMNILPFSTSIGLTGVMLICLIVSLRVISEILFFRKIILFGPYSRDFLGLLLFLWLWIVIGSLILPSMFSGLEVISGEGMYQRLEFNISHVAQIIYITIFFLLVVWSCGVSSPNSMIDEHVDSQSSNSNLLLISFVVAAFFSVYQLLSNISGLPSLGDFILDMPRRSTLESAIVLDLVPRINGSFLESSGAGRFYSAMVAAFLMACYCGLKHRFAMPTIIALLCTLLTFSSTAIVVSSILLSMFGFYLTHPLATVKLKSISKVIFIIFIAIFVSSLYFKFSSLTLPNILSVIEHLTFNKVETDSFETRSSIDLWALKLALETYLLGVGLGSHRSSSFIAQIIVSSGLIGLLVFIFIGLRIFLLPKRFRTNESLILSAAIFGLTLAKSVAGPDLSHDFLWFLVALWLRQICITERRFNA